MSTLQSVGLTKIQYGVVQNYGHTVYSSKLFKREFTGIHMPIASPCGCKMQTIPRMQSIKRDYKGHITKAIIFSVSYIFTYISYQNTQLCKLCKMQI